jgi:RHS repeat-associated protein
MTTAAQLSENSHQGFEGLKAAFCLGSMGAKSNTASEMPVCLRPNGIGSRSSSKERDAETGLDYFGARYYSGAQGRFTSPDPLFFQTEMLSDPQRFNLYAYTRNNPLSFIDIDGRFPAPLHRTMLKNEMAAVQINKTPLFQVFAAGYAEQVDTRHPMDARQHFDSMNYSQIIKNFDEFVLSQDTDTPEGVGSAAHAIADFAAHSNYIELYLDIYPDTKPSDVPTFNQVMKGNDSKLKSYMEKNLATGKFPGSGPGSHADMNKDTKETKQGSQKHKLKNGNVYLYYDYAYSVADRATQEYLIDQMKRAQ